MNRAHLLLVLTACTPAPSPPPAPLVTVPPAATDGPAPSTTLAPAANASLARPAPASSTSVTPADTPAAAEPMGITSAWTRPVGDAVDAGSAPTSARMPAGDRYAVKLATFFRKHVPGPRRDLCVTFRINVDRTMHIWHVGQSPVQSSGDSAFDASIGVVFEKLRDEKTPLPDPPPEVADLYRGRTLNVQVGDGCR